MAFLSEVHIPTQQGRARRAGGLILNWRLMLALAFNVVAWAAIIKVLGALI
jgi:hypothetical protein